LGLPGSILRSTTYNKFKRKQIFCFLFLFCIRWLGNVLFLLRQEKYQKKATKGALMLVASAPEPPPLETPGAHFRWLWSTLTSILFNQKMFRFFD